MCLCLAIVCNNTQVPCKSRCSIKTVTYSVISTERVAAYRFSVFPEHHNICYFDINFRPWHEVARVVTWKLRKRWLLPLTNEVWAASSVDDHAVSGISLSSRAFSAANLSDKSCCCSRRAGPAHDARLTVTTYYAAPRPPMSSWRHRVTICATRWHSNLVHVITQSRPRSVGTARHRGSFVESKHWDTLVVILAENSWRGGATAGRSIPAWTLLRRNLTHIVSSSSSSSSEYYLGGIIALLLQDHRTMSTKSVCSSQ